MGKKVKKKARSGQKEKRVSAASPTPVEKQDIGNVEALEDETVVVKERRVCPHADKAVNLEQVSAKLGSLESVECEECRRGSGDKRSNKGKNKLAKKKGGMGKATWVCLECGHFSCGGVGLPTTPQSHAVQHSKKHHHPLAVQFENPQLRWCFSCRTLLPSDKLDVDSEHKKVMQDIVKLIKGTQPGGANLDFEDMGSESGSASITSAIVSKHSASVGFDGKGGYSVRGFMNLGNTCFFNSVMQNLVAINKLRDYFLRLDISVGPITSSMKKLFSETNPEAGLKGVVNPKSLFGSICSKAPQFRGYQQQDSHELLRCLLDGLSAEIHSASKRIKALKEDDKTPSTDPTFVDAIFGGQLSSTVSCLECGHASVVYEPFLDLSLPLPTKKPPCKKPQTLTRGKKTKPLPKRSGRLGAKTSKSVISLPAQGVTDHAGTSYGPLHSSGDASLDSIDATTLADNMGLSSHVPSATPESESSRTVEAETLTSADSFAWLDYLEPEPLPTFEDLTEQNDDVSTNKCCGNEDSVQLDVSLQKNSEANMEIVSSHTDKTSSDNVASLDNQGQDKALDNHDVASQSDEVALLATQADNSTESCNQTPLAESNMGINSSTTCWEEEAPLQVKDSEVLLLPYTEATSVSCEVSSVAGCEQDVVDFDGFGGLFDEPEESTSCSAKPVSNSSDSDPDEVDNSDAPVSVESCLSFFTKPEQLTKTEHAWQCENCSKILREQKMREKKGLLKHKCEIVVNGYGDINYSDTSPPDLAAANGNMKGNALDTIDHRSSLHKEENNGHLNHVPEIYQKAESEGLCANPVESSEKDKSCSELNCTDKNDTACSSNEEPCDTATEGTELLSGKSKENKTEDKETGSEVVKVARDATKRILINKAPPILTIHLKRFSQDSRGRLSKLSGHVNFKDTIDLKPYIDPSCLERKTYKYQLLGVVEHSGTMRGGHYVAYIRGGKKSGAKAENGDSVWYYASDAYVREVSLAEVLGSEAYILFYEEM